MDFISHSSSSFPSKGEIYIALVNPRLVATKGIVPTFSRTIAATARPSFDSLYWSAIKIGPPTRRTVDVSVLAKARYDRRQLVQLAQRKHAHWDPCHSRTVDTIALQEPEC